MEHQYTPEMTLPARFKLFEANKQAIFDKLLEKINTIEDYGYYFIANPRFIDSTTVDFLFSFTDFGEERSRQLVDAIFTKVINIDLTVLKPHQVTYNDHFDFNEATGEGGWGTGYGVNQYWSTILSMLKRAAIIPFRVDGQRHKFLCGPDQHDSVGAEVTTIKLESWEPKAPHHYENILGKLLECTYFVGRWGIDTDTDKTKETIIEEYHLNRQKFNNMHSNQYSCEN